MRLLLFSSIVSTGDSDFNYTNANYSILANILSIVSGKSYEDLFTEKFITPLGLSNTYFWETVPEDNVAPAYGNSVLFRNHMKGASNFSNNKELYSSLLGAGNVLMSANDLKIFLQNLTNGTLLTSENFSELIETNTNYSGAFRKNNGLLQTNGSLGEYNSSIYIGADGRNMTILLSNGNDVSSFSSLASSIYEEMTV